MIIYCLILIPFVAVLLPVAIQPITTYHNLQIKMIGHLCFHAKLSHSSQACHSFIGKLICQLLSLQGRECWSENISHAKTHTMKCWCPSWKKNLMWHINLHYFDLVCFVVHIWQLLIQASFPMSPVWPWTHSRSTWRCPATSRHNFCTRSARSWFLWTTYSPNVTYDSKFCRLDTSS